MKDQFYDILASVCRPNINNTLNIFKNIQKHLQADPETPSS